MSKRTFSIPLLRIPLHDAWRRSRSAAACLLTGAALTATCIAAIPSAWAEATVPEGATGVWSFEGNEPFKGTGSQGFSIEEVEDPNDSVKVEDSGIQALGKSLSFTSKNENYDIRVRAALDQQKDFSVSFWVCDDQDAQPAQGKRTILLHSAGKQTSILTEWKDGTFSSSIDKDGSNITLGKNSSRTS